MAEAPNTYTAFIDPSFDANDRRRIGAEIISFIKARTKKGQGIGGVALRGNDGDTKYSQSYIDSADFSIAGKSRTKINLTLTGDMLDSMEVIDITLAGRIVIGFSDEGANDKSVWMREKGYNFLGLTSEELGRIMSNFNSPSEARAATESIAPGFARNLLRGLLGN